MPQRMDLELLGDFIKNLAMAGMPMFPDDDLEHYIRDAAGFPDIEDDGDKSKPAAVRQLQRPQLMKVLMGALAKRIKETRDGA